MADPKVVQYTLAVFYLFVGVLIVVLAFTMPQMTTSNSCIFAFLGIFILIASILQLVSIPQFVHLATNNPDCPVPVRASAVVPPPSASVETPAQITVETK